MGKHHWQVFAVSFLVAGCSSEPSAGNLQADNIREAPEYGAPVPIMGKALFGRETSAVVLCPKARESCSAPVHDDGTEDWSKYCWLKITDSARVDLERLHKLSEFEDPGEFWMEGKGRVAVKPGAFGHVGQYGCQVEMTQIAKFEVGPPYFFSIPPPPEPLETVR